MKKVIKVLVNFFNHLLLLHKYGVSLPNSSLFFFRIGIERANKVLLKDASVVKTNIFIKGKNNSIEAESAVIESCIVTIQGSNNSLKLDKGTKLRKANIIIRGINNHIKIGQGTSFGTVRIINVGKDNDIEIGNDCLFSDYIEIWASDTHSIYDQDGKFINPEKPISIGNNVWVGSHVTILKGVDIGDGAIIGMNSMVTKNIEDCTVNVGNPLRVIKRDVTWSNAYAPLVSK